MQSAGTVLSGSVYQLVAAATCLVKPRLSFQREGRGHAEDAEGELGADGGVLTETRRHGGTEGREDGEMMNAKCRVQNYGGGRRGY
jgi:hypothetical protein